jgi:hypothetical protein
MDSADAEGEEAEEAEEGEKGTAKGGEETAPIKRKKKKADPNTAKGKKQVRWDSVGIGTRCLAHLACTTKLF